MKKTMKIGKNTYYLEAEGLVASIYREDKEAESGRVYLMKSRFISEDSMNRYIDEYVEKLKRREIAKENYKKEKKERIKEMKEKLKVGDVVVNNWGCDEMRVDCYLIIEKQGNNLMLRTIKKKLVKVDGEDKGYFFPLKDSFITIDGKYQEITKKIGQFGVEFDHGGSDVWDGKKTYFNSLNNTVTLEKENFRINSYGWETISVPGHFGNSSDSHRDIVIKINSEKDVVEFVSGVHESLVGEQLFTYDAAIRETEKHQKLIPSKKYIQDKVVGSLAEGDRIFEYEQGNKHRIKWEKLMDEWNIDVYLRGFGRLFQGEYSFWFVEDFDYWRLSNSQILMLRGDMYYIMDPISYFGGCFEDTRGEMFCSVRCFT